MGNKLKTVSLFTGAGGLDLGAETAGAEVIFATDIDPVICETLKLNFPKATIVADDIKNIKSFPKADLLIGGYPCQSFSLGGKRNPEKDSRTYLYLEYARALEIIDPKYFVVENVSGLSGLKGGTFLKKQLETFSKVGKGYEITYKVVDAKDYGVPQARKRIFLVGVRKDLGVKYVFPSATHGKGHGLIPYVSHGDVIADLPLWPKGEFYERPDEHGNFSPYFMSRNRKAKWKGPAFTAVANWRHVTLHPGCPIMKLTWSDLKNGWMQRWDFSNEYEESVPKSKRLKKPRRLSWHECARIQTFPDSFVFCGNTEMKYLQIGNAVPPLLAETIITPLVKRNGLTPIIEIDLTSSKIIEQPSLAFAA